MSLKKTKTKELISLFIRVPLLLVIAPVSCLGLGFYWLLNRLLAVDFRIVAWYTGCSKVDTNPYRGPVKQYDREPIPSPLDQESLPELGEILMSIRIRPKAWVNNVRSKMEDSYVGRKARANCKDRRLYAVLKPTKEENLRRIENVFRAMTPEQFEHAQHVSKEQLGL